MRHLQCSRQGVILAAVGWQGQQQDGWMDDDKLIIPDEFLDEVVKWSKKSLGNDIFRQMLKSQSQDVTKAFGIPKHLVQQQFNSGGKPKMAELDPRVRITSQDVPNAHQFDQTVVKVYTPFDERWVEAAKQIGGRWRSPIREDCWQFVVHKTNLAAFTARLRDILTDIYPKKDDMSSTLDRPTQENNTNGVNHSQASASGGSPTGAPMEKVAEIVVKHALPKINQEVDLRLKAQNEFVVDSIQRLDRSTGEVAHELTNHMQAIDAKLDKVLRPVIVHNYIKDEITTHDIGVQHKQFAELLELVLGLPPHERNIWIAGPAGSGKTTAAEKLAEVLGLEFEFNGAIDTEYKLSGFINAQGTFMPTSFYRAWTQGKVYLFDEVDASLPGAILAFNGALSGNMAPFPNGMQKRHENCVILAAANTFGHGGDSKYVGRMKQDAAFLDRFITLYWEYDEAFESALAGNAEWVGIVQKTRKLMIDNGADMVISPRASIKGAYLLRAGLSREKVIKAIFGRYRMHSKWNVIGRYAEEFGRG